MTDEVLARRQRLREASNRAQRVAYALLGVAVVVFFVGVVTSFSNLVVWLVLVPFILGSVILAVAIQVGYAIRGAERHEEDAAAQRRKR